jgi:mannitol-specific phosphotransferase system IIBC component
MAASTMTAVSVSAEQSKGSAAAVTQENSKSENTDVKFGKVTAVNGSEITVALGDFTKTEKSSETSDVKEKKKQSDETSSTDEQQTESSKTKVKGHKGKGGHRGSFTEDGTTVTVTVTDNITVSRKGAEASVSDISEGDIIKLGYNENAELESVKLMKGHKHSGSGAEGSSRSRPAKKAGKSSEQSTEA